MRGIARRTILLAVGAAVMSYGCTDYVSDPAGGVARGEAPAVAVNDARDQAGIAAARAQVSPRAAAAIERSAWVGALHNEMMDDLVRNPGTWMAAGKPRHAAERCAIVAKLADKYIARVFRDAGITPDPREMKRLVGVGVRAVPACDAATMSLFRVPGSRLVAVTDESELVSGAFEQPLYRMGDVQYTDGTPAPVASTVYAIVDQNASVPAADLEVIAGGASTAVSSSEEWAPIYGGSGGSGPGLAEPMSLFRMRRGPFLARIVAADVIGCASGAALSYLDGERRKSYLLAACVVGGATASGMKHIEAI